MRVEGFGGFVIIKAVKRGHKYAVYNNRNKTVQRFKTGWIVRK